MGWSLIKKNSPKDGFDSYKIVEILVDTDGDLRDIPVDKFSPGSIAYTADRSVSATLNTKGEWVKHVGSGSGGGDIEVKQVQKVLLEQKNLTFNEQDGYWEFIIPDAPFYFTTGKTYIVTFAGEEYRLDAVYKGSDYIGNLSIFSSVFADTGEPFAMRNSGTELCIRTTLPGGVYDIAIVDPSEKENELVFSGSGISNVAHCTMDESTGSITAYFGDYPDGDYFELTNKMAKKMIDHYGYIPARYYENGSQVGAGFVTGYNITDGVLQIYW